METTTTTEETAAAPAAEETATAPAAEVAAAFKRAIGLLCAFGGLGRRARASAPFDPSGTRGEVKREWWPRSRLR
jgi:hypothetical protein